MQRQSSCEVVYTSQGQAPISFLVASWTSKQLKPRSFSLLVWPLAKKTSLILPLGPPQQLQLTSMLAECGTANGYAYRKIQAGQPVAIRNWISNPRGEASLR